LPTCGPRSRGTRRLARRFNSCYHKRDGHLQHLLKAAGARARVLAGGCGMAKRCPMCRAPMKEEIVFHRKITLDNKPQLYHYVRRYTCPEGCTAVLDFTKAKPLVPGVRPMVLGRVEKLEKEPDFNDKLLAAGMGVSLLLFLVGIALIPTTIPIKLAAVGALGVLTAALYRFANQRVVLPDSFPLPIPEPEPEEVVVQEAAQAAAPVQTEEAPKVKGTPVTVEIPDVIPPLERKDGEPIKMYVIMEGMQYELEVNEGENMLDAALDRDVELDYSCRNGSCDSCLVRILAGINNISPPTPVELAMLGDEVNKGFRLSCQ